MELPAHHVRQVLGMGGHEVMEEIEPEEYQAEDPNDASSDPSSSSANVDELYGMVGEISNTLTDIARRIRGYDPDPVIVYVN